MSVSQHGGQFWGWYRKGNQKPHFAIFGNGPLPMLLGTPHFWVVFLSVSFKTKVNKV